MTKNPTTPAAEMDSPTGTDRESTTPFLLKLFYRTGSFHRPDELAHPSSLPPHLHLHTYLSATLLELTHHLAAALPPHTLPSPAIGTRLCFRLVYPDTTRPSQHQHDHTPPTPPRYLAKDLGSLVVGEGAGPGADDVFDGDGAAEPSAASTTLAEAKFVVGDYISVAVLPPAEGTGAVVPGLGRAETGRRNDGVGGGMGGGIVPSGIRRDNGYPVGSGRGGRGGGGRGGGGRFRDGARDRDLGQSFPEGEWRRGERVPDVGRPGARRGARW